MHTVQHTMQVMYSGLPNFFTTFGIKVCFKMLTAHRYFNTPFYTLNRELNIIFIGIVFFYKKILFSFQNAEKHKHRISLKILVLNTLSVVYDINELRFHYSFLVPSVFVKHALFRN